MTEQTILLLDFLVSLLLSANVESVGHKNENGGERQQSTTHNIQIPQALLDHSSIVDIWEWLLGTIVYLQKLTEWLPSLLHLVIQKDAVQRNLVVLGILLHRGSDMVVPLIMHITNNVQVSLCHALSGKVSEEGSL